MEERPLQTEPARVVARAAIGAVAKDRVPDRGQVHADLVGPAGLGNRLHERRPVEALKDLEPRLRSATPLGVHDDPRRLPAERRVHRERIVREPPTYER